MPNKSINVNTKLPTLHKFPEKKIQLVTQHNHRPICWPPENRSKKKTKKTTLGDSFKCRMLLESTLHPSCLYVKLHKRKTKLCGVKQPRHLFFRGRIIFQDTNPKLLTMEQSCIQ
ncbi:unnamed protein product [Pipistrellus nathusii]|uniref:Uncharacterized protein n=1 Tax=Pipistrellus nathusii TaxID=59473 RepID=A0ABN9Z6R4_PIPNA